MRLACIGDVYKTKRNLVMTLLKCSEEDRYFYLLWSDGIYSWIHCDDLGFDIQRETYELLAGFE